MKDILAVGVAASAGLLVLAVIILGVAHADLFMRNGQCRAKCERLGQCGGMEVPDGCACFDRDGKATDIRDLY